MKRIGLSGAVFDLTKLNWLNQHYLVHQLSSKDLLERLKGWQLQDSFLEKLCELCHTRIKNLSEFFELSQFLFIQQLALTTELLCPKEQDADTSCAVLQAMVWCLDELENWTSSGFEAASKQLANRLQLNHKKQIMPVLFGALMARKSGLPLFASMDLLGKDRARARLIEALQFLGGISTKRLKELEKTWKASRLIEAT
jgi:glutamyl-tRNA synthetase